MRVAVVGAGAVGCTLAVALVEAGLDVVLCARSPLDAVTLTDDDRGTRTHRVPVAVDPAAARRADHVVLATKIHQTASVAPWLVALTGPDSVVVAAQNGVDHADRVPGELRDRVAPALVYVNAERTGPGRVRARRTERELVLADDPCGRRAAELFALTWLRVETEPDFRTAAWRKLLTNVAANPITALTMRRVEVLREPAVAELALAALRETAAVGRAEGADLPDGAAEETLRWLQGLPAGSTSSMLQDRVAGRRLEADGLTGAVVGLAGRHGIDVPASRALLALTAAVATG
ncbi:2-dehydropantoate 2-reductase [Pseudonocardia petroleophila]|uniref:2-dehydropantoate 2-reductase n=1 Tax=Pseudonocardia petroleophila TaxID=37331 RepID=A0A7G7MB02_9PSEU|nr:2-dehydropantoate 2-reductase [Pseudonocardia petroleophila]QNG49963.1 2-dehydropantoate 2-reductase [Pseudonocardia petroleophila]